MIPLDLMNIKEHLASQSIKAEYQQETDQLYMVFKIAEQEYPVFIRVFEGEELLQLIAFLPCNTKENTLNDTGRLLHLLNKELDTPGFGMDESSSVIFYRTMLPIFNKELNPLLLTAYLGVVQMVCKTFAAVIAAVANGAVSYKGVLAKLKETKLKKSH